jgi:hypothetical protein
MSCQNGNRETQKGFSLSMNEFLMASLLLQWFGCSCSKRRTETAVLSRKLEFVLILLVTGEELRASNLHVPDGTCMVGARPLSHTWRLL